MVHTRPASVCLGLTLSLAVGFPAPALAAPPSQDSDQDGDQAGDPLGDPPGDPGTDPAESADVDEQLQVEQQLREGGRAYQLGDFDRAIENFEAAYEITAKAPLLYNLALSYLRRHDGSREASDLHRARALLTNFAIALEADPSLGDRSNVEALIDQIDAKLAAHEQREAALQTEQLRLQAEAEAEVAAAQDCPVIEAPEPASGRRGRTIGAVVMGTGSVAFAAGIATIAGFAFKGREFTDDLVSLQAERSDLGCDSTPAPAGCATYDQAIDATIINGRRANIFAGTIGGTLTALGAAGLVAGIVVFVRSNAKSPKQARIRVGPGLSGLVVGGRF